MKVLAIALPMVALASLPAQARQVFKSEKSDIRVETWCRRPFASLGLAFLPDGRMLVTERAGPHAHRDARRKAVAAAGRRAEGRWPATRAACSTSSSTRLCEEQHDLFLLFRSGRRRRADRAGARAARCDGADAATRRREGASSGRRARRRTGTAFRLPHRAGARQQPVPHAPATIIAAPRSARRSSTIISARSSASRPMARCRRTIRSSAAPARSRKSGATAIATARARRCIPSTGKLWMHRARPARRRRDQHSRGGQELRLAGDRLRHRLYAARRSTKARTRPAWSSRSGTGRR